jgi:(R,R)-butanediol dehydrogenase/meso-butanediol dehydrogenase/diacetyl reductase
MRALQFHDALDVRIDEVDPPAGPLTGSDVLVRSVLCGICGTDLHEYRMGPLLTSVQPKILGHEFAAVVLDTGPDVTSLQAGDRVAIMPQVYCGHCGACRSGHHHLCPELRGIGVNAPWGGLGEHLLVSEDQATALPQTFSDARAAMIEPAAVAISAVDAAGVRQGDAVLVTGGGAIGQLAALAARFAGACVTIVSEPIAARRDKAAALGFTVHDPGTGDLVEFVHAVTGRDGVEVSIECSGNQQALTSALGALRAGGTAVHLAGTFGPSQIDLLPLVLRNITLRGSFIYPVDCWPRVIRMIESGRFPVEELITTTLPLESAVGAFESLVDPQSADVKVVVQVTEV